MEKFIENIDSSLARNNVQLKFSKFVLFLGLILLISIFLSGAVSAANITVNPGDNAIKNAISNANSGDTLNLSPGTYSEHDILVDKNLTISGQKPSTNNPPTSIIDAGQQGRVFYINPGLNVTIQYITIQNSLTSSDDLPDGAGAVYVDNSELNVNNCSFHGNTAGSGGAICNIQGNLTVKYSTFTSNIADNGGAIYNEAGNTTIVNSTFTQNIANFNAGGIYNANGIVTIYNSTVSYNTALNGNGGGIYNNGAYFKISESNIINNTSPEGDGGNGGGIYNDGMGNIDITDSNIKYNNAAYNGGGIYNNGNNIDITNSNINYNSVSWANGGGIDNNGGSSTIDINNCNISFNSAPFFGGGICNMNIMVLYNSNITNNNGNIGGGICNGGTTTLISCNINNNIASIGGGLENYSGNANFIFCRIVGNTAADGSAIFNEYGNLVYADQNWWGDNNSPYSKLSGDLDDITLSSWLILNSTASPTNILSGASSTLTADLTHDQDGVYYDPTNGHVPDGIPISFTATLGSLNPVIAVIMNGVATSIFTATQNGVSKLTASVDDEIVNSQINIDPLAVLVITNTGNSPVNVGDEGTFTISVTNNGPDTATNIEINDMIPTGLADVTVTPSIGTYDNGIWTIPSLSYLETATLTISGTATASMAGTSTINSATAVWSEYPKSVTITDASIYTKLANVSITQTGNYSNNKVTFIVTATNNGPDNATNIIINDTIPSGFTNVTVTPSIGSYSNGVWTIPNLRNGISATLNITGTAAPQSTTVNNAN